MAEILCPMEEVQEAGYTPRVYAVTPPHATMFNAKSKEPRHRVIPNTSYRLINPGVINNSDSFMQLGYKLSLDSGSFVDTKFFAFSRRDPSGIVCGPRPIYANSWMLKAKVPQYFESCERAFSFFLKSYRE